MATSGAQLPDNDLLTAKEVQEFLRLSVPSAYELMQTPGFPCLRVGRMLRVPKEEFLEWLEGHRRVQA